MKRLHRSETNKVFAGVVGGLGEYFEIDPTVLRLAWVLIVIFTGFFPGVVAYLIAVVVIPRGSVARNLNP
jgi:phage shock protein PspC (stress-responsive transcriptional regulator)